MNKFGQSVSRFFYNKKKAYFEKILLLLKLIQAPERYTHPGLRAYGKKFIIGIVFVFFVSMIIIINLINNNDHVGHFS